MRNTKQKNKSISRFSKNNPQNYSKIKKARIFFLFMFPLILFSGWIALHTYLRSSEKLEDLTKITGVVTNQRIMKHKQKGKYINTYNDVLVISIQGCNDELGFANYNDFYSELSNLVSQDIPLLAEVHYDKSRKRIEENVTLHTFDLKINEKQYIKIEDNKKIHLIVKLT